VYETESDKFLFYTLLYLPLPDCSFYFVPLQVTNFYFNLIQFRMKQKIVHLHSKVNEKGVLVELDLDEEIKKLKRDNYVVKQIASSSSSNIVDIRGTTTFVHVFLLAEKQE
jgi:hypothetical protein